ncbi:MAG TPA: diguanylate cyclase [Ruminococcus sp.]|nr:diguanylate cyclase [Ruminococcus sp.]
MNKKSNVITNIVVILFIVLGAIGFTLVISEYSDVVDNDIASRNYLQQSSIKMHELETDLCIAIDLGRNADTADNTEAIEDYVEKINYSLGECKELMKKYEDIPKNSDEDKQYHLVKTAMNQYSEIVSNEILAQVNAGHFETANSIYFDRFINKRNGLDSSLNELLTVTDDSINKRYDKAVFNAKILRVFFTGFGVIVLILLNILEARRKKIAKNLETAVDTNEKTQESLNNAMFKDNVTSSSNRFSFVLEYGEEPVVIPEGEAMYFMMFDIKDFSGINIRYGSDAGDRLLVSTVDRISDVFEDGTVYRTGSDEFIAVVKADDSQDSFTKIAGLIERAYRSLTSDHEINNRRIAVDYAISLVRKASPDTVDMTIHGQLKQTLTEGKSSASGNWRYKEN